MPLPEQAPDLDLRPGEPARSTLRQWVKTCPSCGAAAPDLSHLPAGAAATITSAPYRACATEPPFARPFLRWSLIALGAGDRNGAAEATLQAAWMADDANDAPRAATYRRNAAAIWGKPTDEAAALRLIDVLRRAGDIPAARAAADAMPEPADEAAQRILAFQRVCLDAADTGRHLISSALRPPARTPHVLHGRETRPGPVSRWLRWSRRGS